MGTSTAAEFKVTTRYSGWESDDARLFGKLRVPPERGFRPYEINLAQARKCVAEYGVELEVSG